MGEKSSPRVEGRISSLPAMLKKLLWAQGAMEAVWRKKGDRISIYFAVYALVKESISCFKSLAFSTSVPCLHFIAWTMI